MADDERILTSFVLAEETLVDTWAIEGLKRGTSKVPPATVGEQVVAVTDRRLLWYDGDLGEIDREDVTSLDRRDFSHTSAPKIVTIGWAALLVGGLVSVVLVLFTGLEGLAALLPAATGLATLLAGVVVARMRGETGTEVDLHRLVVDTGEDAVSIWGESETLDELQAAIDGDATEEASAEPTGSATDHESDGGTGAEEAGVAGPNEVDAGTADDESGLDADGEAGLDADDERRAGGADSTPSN